MNILCDVDRLSRLLRELRALIGIRAAILYPDGRLLCASGPRAAFCARLLSSPEGSERCRNCEAQVPASADGCRFDCCHAGVCRARLPIFVGERPEPAAYLFAGEFLDATCGEPSAAVGGLRRCDAETKAALAGALETLADYIRLKGLIQPAGETDLQRLERFLNEHYMERLTLTSSCASAAPGCARWPRSSPVEIRCFT